MREPAKAVLEKGGVPEPRSIINISSTTGTRGNAGQLNYSAGKSAVLGMTKTIAKEWGMFNIRCNAIAFGRIATRLTADKKEGASITTPDGEKVALGIPGAGNANFDAIPLRRAGTPEEAGASIVMLASPWAGYVTGQTLEVTGGY
jgi:3-oxoacyl-[acyl-carrier protein] reductase